MVKPGGAARSGETKPQTSSTNPQGRHPQWDAPSGGASWRIETVDDQWPVGLHASLALDSSDNPHISYYDESNSDLKYAYYNGSTWIIQAVDTEGSAGWDTSIAVDSSDNPHISYGGNAENYSLMYAYRK